MGLVIRPRAVDPIYDPDGPDERGGEHNNPQQSLGGPVESAPRL